MTVIEDLQKEWIEAAKSLAGSSIKRALDIFSKLMFIEPGQFILEFLQNAEDARFELKKKGGFFRIELWSDKIIIEHNGKPFDDRDIRNLCSISKSKKPSMGYKGYIGIGWKSVFKVSSRVEIFSNKYSFMFSKSYWFSHADELKEKYNLEPDRVPWQVTPIPIMSTEYIPPERTRFIIYLDDLSYYDEIARTVNELKPHIFLFLEYINKIEIIDHVKNKSRIIEWFNIREETFNDTKIQEVVVNSYENKQPIIEKFIVFRKTFSVPDEVRKDPITVDAERSDVTRREVAIAFLLDPSEGKVKPIEEGQFWGVYSFLPLHEVRSGLRFLIQADFIVHPGRRYINYESKWNYWLMQCLAEVVKTAIKYLAQNYRKYYLRVFEYRPVDDLFFYRLAKPTIINTIDEVLKDPEVVCIKGEIVKLSSTVKFDENIAELIKQGLISEDDLEYIYGSKTHLLDPNIELREEDERKVRKLSITKLLNKNLIEAKLKSNSDTALKLLAEIYKQAYINNTYIHPDFRLVITQSGKIKLAKEVYYSEIPQEVNELAKRFPEVGEYIKNLDFIHEKLAKLLNEDLIYWIGVKKIKFEEICEKILLQKIYTDNPPPSKEELLTITSIIKQAGIFPNNKPIWAISSNGHIKRSDKLYFPFSYFEPRELLERLGIDFINIQEYTKYDNDINGWKTFFSRALSKGFEDCKYTYQGLEIHDDYRQIINKLKSVLDSTRDKNINIEYVRLLKQLYQNVLESCWNDAVAIKVFTDDGSTVYSTECLLHDDYDPEEKWVIWRNKGFKIGPFISPEYLSKRDNVSSWHKFLTKALGVKERVSKEDIERFAIWYTENNLQNKKYLIKERKGEGYDILAEKDNKSIYIEVKGRRELTDIELTEKETQKAMELRQDYWLIVVKDIPHNPKAILIKDPIKFLTKMVISKKQLEEQGVYM